MTPEEQQEFEEAKKKCLTMLGKARIAVRAKGPYFMPTLLKLVPVFERMQFSMAVSDTGLLILDPIRITTDPEFAPDDKGCPWTLAGALVHEVNHILRGMNRIKDLAKTHPEIANIAADLAINTDLRKAGWPLPKWVVYPERYGLPEGLTMEQYFAELMKDPEETDQKTGRREVGAGACGSVAGNGTKSEQQVEAEHADKARSTQELNAAATASAREAQKFFEAKQGAGSVPEWADSLLERANKRPDRDWEKEVGHVVRRSSGIIIAGGADFSMRRPSKRSMISDFLRPGMIEQRYTAFLGFDVSGSMGEVQMNHAKDLACGFLQQTGIDSAWVCQFDTAIVKPPTLQRLRDVENMHRHAQGGTDFRPVFKHIQTMRPRPDLVMIFSDGDGPAPNACPPGMAVIWVIVPSHWRRKPTDWGHYVICSNDHGVADGFR